MLLNWVSRFDVAKRALKGAAETNDKIKAKLDETLKKIDARVEEVRKYIRDEGKGKLLRTFDKTVANKSIDPEDLYDMPKF